MIGAIIGGVASIAGGIFGRKSEKKENRRVEEYNNPTEMRKRAEDAGFNPLLWAGLGNTASTNGVSNHFGNGIANAGLAIADGMDKEKQLKLEKTRLQQDRERLDKLIERQTIRPKVGGIYAGNSRTPAVSPSKTGSISTKGHDPKSPWSGKPETFNAPSVMRDDGMTSANPDAPAEMESDMWDWARRGTLVPNVREIFKRNMGTTDEQKAAAKKAAEKWEKRKEETKEKKRKPAPKPNIPFPSYLPSISD